MSTLLAPASLCTLLGATWRCTAPWQRGCRPLLNSNAVSSSDSDLHGADHAQSQAFDEIAARIGKALESSPAKDIEKNVKAMLSSSLARLDLVPRAEFEVQAQVLLKTREKLEALEKRLAELEERFPPPTA